MNRKEAIELDVILKRFKSDDWLMQVSEREMKTCDTLEALGYIEIIDRKERKILLKEMGNEFRARDSFVSQVKSKKWVIINAETAFWTAIASVVISVVSFLWQLIK